MNGIKYYPELRLYGGQKSGSNISAAPKMMVSGIIQELRLYGGQKSGSNISAAPKMMKIDHFRFS